MSKRMYRKLTGGTAVILVLIRPVSAVKNPGENIYILYYLFDEMDKKSIMLRRMALGFLMPNPDFFKSWAFGLSV